MLNLLHISTLKRNENDIFASRQSPRMANKHSNISAMKLIGKHFTVNVLAHIQTTSTFK